MYVSMYLCTYACIYVCKYVLMYLCMYVLRTYAPMYVCTKDDPLSSVHLRTTLSLQCAMSNLSSYTKRFFAVALYCVTSITHNYLSMHEL